MLASSQAAFALEQACSDQCLHGRRRCVRLLILLGCLLGQLRDLFLSFLSSLGQIRRPRLVWLVERYEAEVLWQPELTIKRDFKLLQAQVMQQLEQQLSPELAASVKNMA